jgi:hypothetical protein
VQKLIDENGDHFGSFLVLLSLYQARFKESFIDIDIKLPAYIPPSPQAFISANRSYALTLTLHFRITAVHFCHTLANFDLSKPPKQEKRGKPHNSKKLEPRFESIEEMGKIYVENLVAQCDLISGVFHSLIVVSFLSFFFGA